MPVNVWPASHCIWIGSCAPMSLKILLNQFWYPIHYSCRYLFRVFPGWADFKFFCSNPQFQGAFWKTQQITRGSGEVPWLVLSIIFLRTTIYVWKPVLSHLMIIIGQGSKNPSLTHLFFLLKKRELPNISFFSNWWIIQVGVPLLVLPVPLLVSPVPLQMWINQWWGNTGALWINSEEH